MKTIEVMSVIGTRPEAIKMAPVVQELARTPGVKSLLCSTGQHREMLDAVLPVFGLKPDVDLNIMRQGQDLSDVTSAVLTGMRQVFRERKPDFLLVQGDTTTAMAAALAGFYEKIPVGHVEAGLRTNNLYAPWPEEGNRRIISAVAELHFPPTAWAREALLREGTPEERIIVTGNTVVDALVQVLNGFDGDEAYVAELEARLPMLKAYREPRRRDMILVTGHRRESFGKGFEDICTAIRRLAEGADVDIIYPVHLNPNVREPVHRLLGNLANVHLLPPQDYRPFVYLMKCATLILTDSGGIQEEAPTLKKPVLVMREVTERREALHGHGVKLVGTDPDRIVSEAMRILKSPSPDDAPDRPNPYGDGLARKRIVEAVLNRFAPRDAAA